MILGKLLERLDYSLLQGDTSRDISAVIYDSRKVCPGCLFIAVVGARADGHRFLKTAAEAGAAAVVIEKGASLPEDLVWPEALTVIETENTRYAMALISAAWFGYPADTLPVIGITGTKGKTTTTYLVKSILENAGYRVGLIGTIEIIIGNKHIPAEHTTPESYVLQSYLRAMKDEGLNMVVMEVSSQALMLHRTAGIPFEIGVFTNIEPDHIGPAEHSSFENYLSCKSLLFRQCRQGIFNADDPHLEEILRGHTCAVTTYAVDRDDADLTAGDIRHIHEPGYLGVRFTIRDSVRSLPVELDIPGKFSVYNALAAAAICRHFGIGDEAVVRALKEARVKGRIEMIPVSDTFTLMIDYAHNAMALRSLLETLRDYPPKRLVCLFGCGGNRSRSRRFEMGEVSGRMADLTIITSDNPRDEDPQAIIDDIKTGIAKTAGRYVEIIDRREAIAYAIDHGQSGDIIVLAGKGHEDYQEIKGQKYPMDERVIIEEHLKNR